MWRANMWFFFFFFLRGVGGGDGGGVEITSHAVFIFLYFYLLNLASLNLDPAWVNPAWLQNLCSQLGLGKGANTISWSVPRADTGKHNQRREREQQLELRVFLCWDTRRWFQAQSLKQLARPHSSQCVIHPISNNQKVLILHSVGEGTGKWLLLVCWLECKWFPLFKFDDLHTCWL